MRGVWFCCCSIILNCVSLNVRSLCERKLCSAVLPDSFAMKPTCYEPVTQRAQRTFIMQDVAKRLLTQSVKTFMRKTSQKGCKLLTGSVSVHYAHLCASAHRAERCCL